MLPAFTCGQYGECDPYNGQCNCPPGWGGIDCLTPRKCPYLCTVLGLPAHVCTECDSLADGSERHLREEGKECQCKEGWDGINCNGISVHSPESAHDSNLFPVCQTDSACINFPILGDITTLDAADSVNMTCYKGGETVFNNHQFCDVTSMHLVIALLGSS
jgi:hypothetical protein